MISFTLLKQLPLKFSFLFGIYVCMYSYVHLFICKYIILNYSICNNICMYILYRLIYVHTYVRV